MTVQDLHGESSGTSVLESHKGGGRGCIGREGFRASFIQEEGEIAELRTEVVDEWGILIAKYRRQMGQRLIWV